MLVTLDLESILRSLANDRPIFHSERDFQHALAWRMHETLPAAHIRPEYRPSRISEPLYLDIWADHEGERYAIELKYKTKGLNESVAEETYSLRDQRAHDIARYDFINDISRLEKVVDTYAKATGYALLLTNDDLYWKRPTRQHTNDSSFRLHQEHNLLGGKREWGSGTSDGTKQNRENAIVLRGSYQPIWQPYSKHGFRYLLVKVSAAD